MFDTLVPFQIIGARWLSENREAFLADEMGVGKSAQVVKACDYIGAERILIVCPAVARINWSREFTRFSPLDRECQIIESASQPLGRSGVVICSFNGAADMKLIRHLAKERWDVLVIDEAHFLKEPTSTRTVALYGTDCDGLPKVVAGSTTWGGLKARAARTWRLSGTPAPNWANELWTHLHSAGIYKQSHEAFTAEFCVTITTGFGKKIVGHKNEERLKAGLKSFMLRRLVSQVMTDLPALWSEEVVVEPAPVDMAKHYPQLWSDDNMPYLYQQLSDERVRLTNAYDSLVEAANVSGREQMDAIHALGGSITTLRRYIGLSKAPAVAEIVARELDAKAYTKIVLFAHHTAVVKALGEALSSYGAVTLWGGTSAKARQKAIDRFQDDGSCQVFVGQLTAAGTAITLTSACEVGIVEWDYVPATIAQAIKRVHRRGQTRTCHARFFSCTDSKDEAVMAIVRRKVAELAKIDF